MDRLEPSPRKPVTSRTPQPVVRPATAPRPVAGPEGGRISLQMGKSGDEYLLLLNEDDGEDEWQTRSSSSIPDGLVAQLDRLQAGTESAREEALYRAFQSLLEVPEDAHVCGALPASFARRRWMLREVYGPSPSRTGAPSG